LVLTEYYIIMSIRKFLFTALSLLLFQSFLFAQNTNSPYSRYGLGLLENGVLGKSRSMGGIGYGLKDKSMINPLNPASYSAVDTLNFMFDFGLSSSYSSFKENGISQGNPNGTFDYVAIKIPLKRYWGLAIGLMPYSNVGYKYSVSQVTPDGAVSYTETATGTGGLNTLFLGSGISLGENWSIGANLKYIFGTINKSQSILYDNTDYISYYPSDNWSLAAPSLDLGFQYERKFGKKNKMTFGGTYSIASPFTINDLTHVKLVPSIDTVITTTNSDFNLPTTLGVGATYTYDNRLTIGLDYQNQLWSKADLNGTKNSIMDINKISAGLEYLPSLLPNNYFQALKYRCGFQLTDSYVTSPYGNISKAGVTFGFGLPIRGQKSVVNLAIEAGKLLVSGTAPIRENYYKLSLDVSFNEMWFFKRKL